jgi:hypothetical protein
MTSLRITCLSVFVAINAPGFAAELRVDHVVRLQVAPKTVRLTVANRRQHLMITAVTRSGRRFDVTQRAELRAANPSVAGIESTGTQTNPRVVVGKADGKTTLHIRYGGIETTVPVTVSAIAVHPPVQFVNDVVPVFSKLGCNSGGCHGKASGQNGFRLSVFGS